MSKRWTALILAVTLMFGPAAIVSADTVNPVTEPDQISGTYNGEFLEVTLTSNEPGTVYYTLDGSTPTETNFAGSGADTVTLSVYDFYNELVYRTKDTAGNWESAKREFYKISADPVVPVASTNAPQYYTNYVSVDGSNLVYAKRVNEGAGAWPFKEVHLIQSGTDTAIAPALTEEVDYTGISGDHVIYGNESKIYHYSISNGGQPEQIYASSMDTPDISRVKIDGNRAAFIEDNKLKILDITDPAQPLVTVLDGDPGWDMYSYRAFDLNGNKAVWNEGDQVYLKDLSSGTVEIIPVGHYPDHLMLTDTTVYYADEGALFAYSMDDGQISKLATHVDYGYLPSSTMEIDRSNPSFIVFRGYAGNGSWIGVLNLNNLVIKYLDFDGEYSDLGTFSMDSGVAYWTKEHLYYDEVQNGYYIDRSPLYSLDLNNLPADNAAPTVSLDPNAGSFVWEGTAKFSASEEVLIRYTLDGSIPSETNGYTATMLDEVPVFEDGTVIKFSAVDYKGNSMAAQTSGIYTVAKGAERITSNHESEEFAAAGSSVVYAAATDAGDSKLYLYDIPTRSSTLLADGFTGENLDFDGRYIVYESGSWFNPVISYMDLATGQTGEIAQDAEDPHIKDGKMAYIDQSGDTDGVSVYDFATGETIVIPESLDDLENPYISGNLVVFFDWWNDTAYVYALDTNTLTELAPPEIAEIDEAVPMDGKVYILANGKDELWVYDIASGTYTDLTALAGTGSFSDLSVDKWVGKKLAVTDDDNNKTLVYDAEAGTFTSVGSGDFYLYDPQIAGNVLVMQGDYGLPLSEDELFLRLLSDDAAPPDVTVTPAAGSYNTAQTVSFSVYGEPASVYYTLDGSEPTAQSAKYYGPFKLTGNTTVKYFAIDAAGDSSAVESVSYVIDYTAPEVTANPSGGSYREPQTVFLSSNEPADIYYSSDGSEPTVTWSVYEQTHGLSITDDTVLKFKAVDALGNESAVQTVQYIIDPDAPQVSATPAGGLYHGDVTVTMFVYQEETSADIYYTLDGSDPTAASTKYTGPFVLTQTADLKYFAQDAVENRTPVITVHYEIVKIPPAATPAPAHESRGVLIQTPVTAAFDADVTLHHPGGVTLTSGDQAVSGVSASLSGRVLTVSHGGLQKGKTYLVQIAADTVRNIYGVGNEPVTWSFTTEFNLPSAVLSPADGATGVSPDASITASFSESVTANDLSGIAISRSGSPVEGVQADLSHNVLTISHDRLERGAAYTVTIPAGALHNPDGKGNTRIEWSFRTEEEDSESSSSPAPAPGLQTQQEEDAVERAIRLGEEDYSLTQGMTEDGRTLTTAQVDAGQLIRAARSLKEIGANALVLQIEEGADAAQFQIPAAAMANAAAEAPDAVLSVRTPEAAYDLPFGLLGLPELADELGTGLDNMQVVVTMSKAAREDAQRFAEAAGQSGAQILGDLIEFRITVEAGGQTREVNGFGNTFVTRSILISQPVDGSSATAVLYNPETGEMTFVPAVFTTENGKTRVTIKRNGNSLYTVVSVKKNFADVTGHWAEEEIELLASKMLVSGKDAEVFAPDDAITRAEFAALIVRALGLSQDQAGAKFIDVQAGDWYAGSVGAAAKAGIIRGYEDGSFRPNERISREQMAVLVSKAMSFAGRQADIAGRQNALLAKFNDRQDISGWAKDAVAQAVEAGVISGLNGGKFAAKDDATRAQAVVMLKKLLQYLEFMN